MSDFQYDRLADIDLSETPASRSTGGNNFAKQQWAGPIWLESLGVASFSTQGVLYKFVTDRSSLYSSRCSFLAGQRFRNVAVIRIPLSQCHFFRNAIRNSIESNAKWEEIAREKYVWALYNCSQHGISYYVRFWKLETWAANGGSGRVKYRYRS